MTLGGATTVNVSGGTLTVGGRDSGNYGLTLSGSGLLNLGTANVYTGDTTISSGVLQAGTTHPLPYGAGNGNLVFSGSAQPAVLDLNGYNVAVNGLSQPSVTSQTVIVNNGSGLAVLSVGNNGNTSHLRRRPRRQQQQFGRHPRPDCGGRGPHACQHEHLLGNHDHQRRLAGAGHGRRG